MNKAIPMLAILKKTLFVAGILYLAIACKTKSSSGGNGWDIYRGDEGSNAWSPLDDINIKNVTALKVAWMYRTHDNSDYSTIQCNPIIVDKKVYGISPRLKAFALDAATGKELWVFDPFPPDSKDGGVCRGLTYWKGGDEERIFLFAANKLIAINARTGKRITDFGEGGSVDLRKGLYDKATTQTSAEAGNTSPGIIYKDLIIAGSSVSEDYDGAPGHIRAYDVRTGEIKWIFHTIPKPGELGYETWPVDSYKTAGGCNAWGGLSIDSKRGIVFAATGAPAFDFHGGERAGQNLFGNSILALDAASGKLIWYYQVSHHDLWDYDLPAPPNLVTIKKEGKEMDAVAQVTKQGYIFLLERQTGKPIFPITEKPVAASRLADEQAWPTQPVPLKPLPLCRQKFDETIISDLSAETSQFVLNEAKKYQWGGIYLPPSVNGIIQMPGFRGGFEWSGTCVDSETGIMYAGINDIPNVVQLLEKKDDNKILSAMPFVKAGEILYQKNCGSCHGKDLKGNTSFPPLVHIEKRFTPSNVSGLLQKPRGMMPSFSMMPGQDKDAILDYLFKLKNKKLYKNADTAGNNMANKKRYSLKGYTQLLDQNGYPGVKPPWGTLNAVDLNSGEIVWKIPLGRFPELAAKGYPDTGTQLFGGGIVTAGGLIFIAASQDEKFRAIDKHTGKILWEYQLPAGGYATPSTYAVDGKQYVVIAAGGGGRQRTKTGDYYVAFALP